MCYFLSNYNIVTNASPFNEGLLRGVNIIRQVGLEPICNAFGNTFIDHIS
jgi:hypothetical protein